MLSVRQERFAQLVAQGIPPYRAYPEAGYNTHPGAPYRLCGNVRVKARIAQLMRGFAVKARVTVESLTSEFDRAIELAEETKNPSALTAAVVAKGKLHGHMVDRKETGAPGDFAGLTTTAEIIAKAREELGDEAAEMLMAVLEKPDYPQPTREYEIETKPKLSH
jgi:hypothetical protein